MPVISGRIAKLGRNHHGPTFPLKSKIDEANTALDTYLCLKLSEDVFPENSDAGEQTASQIQHVAFQSTLPWSPPASRIGSTSCHRAPGRCVSVERPQKPPLPAACVLIMRETNGSPCVVVMFITVRAWGNRHG
ncbi:hypothetical protein ZTR_10497 [Talaromyces verruculosus]|nr:hypothetical protein ZTR_10497 [Talaromyces verruculosus]